MFIPVGSNITENNETTYEPLAVDKCSTYQTLNEAPYSTLYKCEQGDSNGYLYSFIGQDNCQGIPTYTYTIQVNGTCYSSDCIGYSQTNYDGFNCTGNAISVTTNVFIQWDYICHMIVPYILEKFDCIGDPEPIIPVVNIYNAVLPPRDCSAGLIEQISIDGCWSTLDVLRTVIDNPCTN